MTGSLWGRGQMERDTRGQGGGGTREMRFYSNFLLIVKSFVLRKSL